MSDYYYDTIRRLFHTILYEKIRNYQLNHADIRTGIQNMKEVYKPNPMSLSSDILDVANYNDPAHRCAYLHKYAPLHTALVRDMLLKSMEQVKFIFEDILLQCGRIEICSLGGGPGSDVLGVISVLFAQLGYFQLSATIIDCMENWGHTFSAIIEELRCGNYGFISNVVQPQYFSWNYIGHNLLGKMTNDINKTIQGTNLLTMIKFVSAAACKDTAEMVKKIFRSLKPGALVLFIDNDAGGFYRLVVKGAQESSMVTVFGPLIHEHYINKSFDVKRFGYTPCLETKVTVHMWIKPNYNRLNIMSAIAHGNSSQMQTQNVTNVFNHYSVSNTNIYVSETNNLNIPSDITSQKHFPNQSSHIPFRRQPQDQVVPSSNSKTNNLSKAYNEPKRKATDKLETKARSQLSHTSNQRDHNSTNPVPRAISASNNLNRNSPKKKAIQQNARSQSHHTAIQIQPQYVTPNHNLSNSNNRESEVDCCNCCVIS